MIPVRYDGTDLDAVAAATFLPVGEVIERQIIKGAAPHLLYRRFKRIAPEALP